MKVFVMHDGPRYRLTSHGNGLSYLFVRLGEAENMEAFIQGDDAITFDTDKENCERAHLDWSDDEVLHYLWTHCGYAEIAEA